MDPVSDIITNPNSSQEDINKFANHENLFVRYHVASYTKSIEVLIKLTLDESYIVKSHVAMNDYTPRFIFERLSKDPNFTVRHCLLGNKKLSDDIVKDMMNNDVNADLREKARSMLYDCLE